MTQVWEADVVVVGGGAAGVAAAVAAARHGAAVVLIEKYGFLGGMATAAMVGTVCGGYLRNSCGAQPIPGNFCDEFLSKLYSRDKVSPEMFGEGLWYLPYDPFSFRLVCDSFIREHSRITPYFHSSLCNVTTNGREITAVSALVLNKIISWRPRAIVDCSGESVVSLLAGASMASCRSHQAGALVFELSGFDEAPSSTLWRRILHSVAEGIQRGELSPALSNLSLVPGTLALKRMLLKLSLPELTEREENTVTVVEGASRSLVDDLRKYVSGSCDECRRLFIVQIAPQIGIRTSPRPLGQCVLTEENVQLREKVQDPVAYGAWPIEEWGKDRGPKLTYFQEGEVYGIPAGALIARDLDNLYFAGRGISATERAIASARVIGTCLETGFAAGLLAGR
jgi:hypothetical protein